jgi:hypothetical protein
MKAIEYWVLRIADSDATWFGLGWLRPAKHKRVGFCYVLFSSILLGLPGVVAGAGLIYLFMGRVEQQAWLTMFLLVLCFELPMHGLFAHFWNRRVKKLAGDGLAA